MPTTNLHFFQLIIQENKQTALLDEIRMKAFDITTERGFIKREEFIPRNGVSFRLIHPKTIKAKTFDPKSKNWSSESWGRHWATDAVLDFNSGMAFIIGSRSGFKVLNEYFDEYFDTSVQLLAVEVDIAEMLNVVKEAYKNTEMKKINVSEFVSTEKLVSRGSFRVLKNSDDDKFIEKWKSEINSWSLTIPDGSEKVKLTANRKGSISISDNAPQSMIDSVKEILFDHVSLEEIGEPEPLVVPPPAPIVPIAVPADLKI